MKAIYPPFHLPGFSPNFTGYDIDEDADWNDVYQRLTPNDSLAFCQYNTEWCRYDREFERIATNMGFCLSFNNGNVKYTSREPGSTSGMLVGLYVNQDDYLYANSPSAGFRILLHGHKEQPMMVQRALKVAPGFSTMIAFTEKHIKDLPSPYGNCESSKDYVQSKCLADCEANYVIEKCNCKDIHMPGDAPVCNPKMNHLCLLEAQKDYVRYNEAAKCNCSRQCLRLIYQPTVSQSRLSFHAATYLKDAGMLKGTVDDIMHNYCIVEIFFSELTVRHVETQEAYSWLSLLCDIGGALGLILGSTVLTMCEWTDFLFILAASCIKVRASTGVGQRQKNCNVTRGSGMA